MSLRPALLAAAALLAAPAPALAQSAAAVHRDAIVLDTHFDTPMNFGREGWSIMNRHAPELDGSQVDYPRMVEGGVDGGVFTVFTAQGPRTPEGHAAARDAALYRALEIHQVAARHNRQFAIAVTADEAEAAVKAGRRFMILSMENSYPIGRDLSLMRTFHRFGVRMMGPVHGANNELADSSTDAKGAEWGGLSPLGREFVAEANRLGVVIDGSHASDLALDQMIALSKTPVILSHSGLKAVFDHPRNIDDARLKALAAKGGVIQINAFSAYMVTTPPSPERQAALMALMRSQPARRTQAQQIALQKARLEIERKHPLPRATLDDFMNHLMHAVRVAGPDHVGISGDFDGGGGIEGLNDVTGFPEVTRRMLAAGLSPEDVRKIWGGNALRVMREAEAMAKSLAAAPG